MPAGGRGRQVAAGSRRDGGAGAWRMRRGGRAVPAESRACAWCAGLATEVERIRAMTGPRRSDSIEADPPPMDRARSGSRSSEQAVVGEVATRRLTGVSRRDRPECNGRDRPVRSPGVSRNRVSNRVSNRGCYSASPRKTIILQCFMQESWRMGWDSNPRGTCAPAGFQDRCLRPLGHPSAARYHQSACLRSSRKRHRSASWPIGALLCYRAREAAPAPERITILELAGGARAWRNW